ncbi:hypothetical protein [Methanocella conradii]|uniref:hypothetical protein n=1 Tax=Methanocella conradii TaxID=1175444 RepID=UPI0024B386DB|nr:hypothetical protein [Methanocella conradii]MDI6897613.1 hypothetical protein [Methanocella conradii]
MSRLKGSANPVIVKASQACRGNAVDVLGKKLGDVLPSLKRQLLAWRSKYW